MTENSSVAACQDATVTKHVYNVRIASTMGEESVNREIPAGSKAHAALLAGSILILELLDAGEINGSAMHNIMDHFVVDVELVG